MKLSRVLYYSLLFLFGLSLLWPCKAQAECKEICADLDGDGKPETCSEICRD